MKPRLKLNSDGGVEVVSPGVVGWNERAARLFVRTHYGSLQAFAIRYRLPYYAVCNAVGHVQAERTAGPTATVRQMLGLKSNPTQASISLARAQAARRAR